MLFECPSAMRGLQRVVSSFLTFWLCCGHTLSMAELGEFSFVSYHLILDYNLYRCHLKGIVRWEAHGLPFFGISIFPVCSTTIWVWQNSMSSASFLMILYSILINLRVVWMAQCNERPAMFCFFAFWVFYHVVATPWVWQNSVSSPSFLIILYLILIYIGVV